MKIGIDVSMITPSKAGIGYYASSLLKALVNLDKDNHYLLYTNNKENLKDLNLRSNFTVKELKSEKANLGWMWRVYRDFLKERIDIFISPSNLFFGAVYSNTITVIHDLSQIKYPQFFSTKGRLIYKIELNLLLKREKIIVVASETVKKEVMEYGPSNKNKVHNINGGLHDWAYKKIGPEELLKVKQKYNLPEKYFISISTLEPRKNYINTIKAFADFSKEHSDWYYLIVGKKGWFYDKIFETVKEANIEDKVIFLGYVPEEDLPGLIDQSLGLLYLSLYEGFGLPLLEASSRGVIVLASDIPVFREIANNIVLFADPTDVPSISHGMLELSSLEKKQALNISTKYTWDEVATKLLGLFPLLKKD